MNKNLIENEDFQTVTPSENGLFTIATLNTESESNSGLLEDFQNIDNIPVIPISTISCFDLNNLPKTETLNTLLSDLCELMIRFDGCVKDYQKSDYEHLIKTITNSLIKLYTDNQSIDDLENVINFIGLATLLTNPIEDSINLNHKYPGIYILSQIGNYTNFGLTISENDLKNSIIYAIPNIVNGVFINYNKVDYNIITNTKLSEFENDEEFISEAPNDSKQYIRKNKSWQELEEGMSTVYTDGTTITGDGSIENPLVAQIQEESDPIFNASQAKNITYEHILVLNNTSGINTGDQDLSGTNVSFTPTTTILSENVEDAIKEVEGKLPTNDNLSKWEPISTTTKTIKYGRLYNWFAITDPRGIAPAGWHVPSKEEFETLITYLGGVAGAYPKLKSEDLKYWNTVGTNESGFSAYGAGYYQYYHGEPRTFSNMKEASIVWTNTEYSSSYTYSMMIIGYLTEIMISSVSSWKASGYSVRLIKDDGVNEGPIVIDGDTYTAVTIGTQVWLQQNLAVTHYQNGDPIGSDFSGTEGAVVAYDNDENNVYDIVVTTDINHIRPKDSKRIFANIIDNLPYADGGILNSVAELDAAPQGKFYGVQLPENHPELGIDHFSLMCMRGGSQEELIQVAIGYDGATIKLWLRGGETNSYGPFNQISGGGGGTGDEVDPVFAAWLDTYTKELAVTKQGFNGEISPAVYPVDKERTIIGYRLGSNATDFSVTIDSVNYTKADITNVVVPVNTEITINDVTIAVGKDTGNVVLILK